MFAEIEAKAAPHYDALISGAHLHGQFRADMASFLAFMFSGTDYWRRIYGEGRVKLLQSRNFNVASNPAVFESTMRRYERIRGTLTAKEKEDLRQGFLNPQGFRIEFDKTATLAAISLHDDLCPLFFRMNWSIIVVEPPHFFITGDTPLVRLLPSEFRKLGLGGGIIHPNIEVTFPLSPHKCLLITHNKMPSVFQINDSEAIHEINKLRAHYAERFLYADRDDDGVRMLAQQFRAKAEGFEFSSPGPREYALVEVKRRSPTGSAGA